MNKKWYLHLAVLVSLLGLLLGVQKVTSPVYAQDTGQNHEILFSIPVGDGGIHYGGTEHPDMLVWGPAAITVGPDGNFWILDTAGNQLLEYSVKGTLLNKINIEDFVVGAGDIEVTSKAVWLLDEASQPPKVIRLALGGQKLGAYELPKGLQLRDGLSGIALGEGNQILIEREGGSKLTRFLASDGKVDSQALKGYPYAGKAYMARPADLQSKDKSKGLITAGNVHVDVTVTNGLGGLFILGRHADNSFFIIVEEVVVVGALQVDQTVRHYSSSGKLLGIARIPIADQYTTVSHGIVVGPDGEVYALITKPDHVEVQRLRFSQELNPILPTSVAMDAKDDSDSSGETTLDCLRWRGEMLTTAEEYAWNVQYLSSTNINNGTCAFRTKPRYLTTPRNYTGVSYDWSGFDSVSEWNDYMNSGYQAGDIDSTGDEGCSKGVDCSGFVSQVWGLPEEYGTCELEYISTELDGGIYDLQTGDIMNRCAITPRHTVMFENFGTNGFYGYESTTYKSYDRVLSLFRPWSTLPNYVPRRYDGVCD